MAYAGGPLVSCIMFWRLGDEWTIDDCLVVMMVGLVLSVIPSAMCFFFDDDKAIGKQSTARPYPYAHKSLLGHVVDLGS